MPNFSARCAHSSADAISAARITASAAQGWARARSRPSSAPADSGRDCPSSPRCAPACRSAGGFDHRRERVVFLAARPTLPGLMRYFAAIRKRFCLPLATGSVTYVCGRRGGYGRRWLWLRRLWQIWLRRLRLWVRIRIGLRAWLWLWLGLSRLLRPVLLRLSLSRLRQCLSAAARGSPARRADARRSRLPGNLPASDPSLERPPPADAIVTINGEKSAQNGSGAEFVSSGLAPGRTYTYEVRAQWTGRMAGPSTSRRRIPSRPANARRLTSGCPTRHRRPPISQQLSPRRGIENASCQASRGQTDNGSDSANRER